MWGRINFLELLRHEYTDYQLTEAAFTYMKRYHVAPWICQVLYEAEEKICSDKNRFDEHLQHHQITHAFYVVRWDGKTPSPLGEHFSMLSGWTTTNMGHIAYTI